MVEVRGRKVAVFGLARSGLSAISLLDREGARIVAVDARSREALGDAVTGLVESGVSLCLGEGPTQVLTDADLVVVSPGVPLVHPALQAAREAGVEVIGEVELAFGFLPESAKVIGITGTNGKSTTTALTGALLEAARIETFVGGNLGVPLSEALAWEDPARAYVIELSSYQLEGIQRFRAGNAAVLNVTPDHLDRYPSVEDYAEAKGRLFLNQRAGDHAIANADDPRTVRLAARSAGSHWFFSATPGSGHEGAMADGEGGFLVRTSLGQGHLHVRSRALRGRHNLENAMAAALLAHGAGVPFEAIQRGLDGFGGLPHRLEFVRNLDGVEYVNDSKATNVDSSVVALAAFPSDVWLIAGGKGKGASYAPLVEAARGKVKGVLTVGADAAAIEAAFEGTAPVESCGTLDAAVKRAHAQAREGDVVLLSPACASLDQFRSFEHRGEVFKAAVAAL